VKIQRFAALPLTILCLNLFVTGVQGAGTNEPNDPTASPVMLPSGQINCGAKSVGLKQGYGELQVVLDGDILFRTESLFNFGHGTTAACHFKEKGQEVDTAAGTAVFTADIPRKNGSAEIIGQFELSLAIVKPGLIEVSSWYELSKPDVKVAYDSFHMILPAVFMEGTPLIVDGRPCLFDQANREQNPPANSIVWMPGTAKELVFFPAATDRNRNFTLRIEQAGAIQISEGTLMIRPDGKRIRFTLDFRKVHEGAKPSADYYSGIDFWKLDRLHLYPYTAFKNRLPNPSFEAGLQYYQYKTFGSFLPLRYTWLYKLDNQEAKFGRSSLLVRAIKGKENFSVGTFAMPVDSGQRYTFSFYAKGDLPKGLSLVMQGRTENAPDLFDKTYGFALTNTWQRYQHSFTAKKLFAAIYLYGVLADACPESEGRIWVDGLQLEEGDMTEFVQCPVQGQLVGARDDNFYKPDDRLNLALNLSVAPGTTGRVALAVTDFFDQPVWKGRYSFGADSNGLANIPLPLEDMKRTGIFVVKADYEPAGGVPFTDYFRFAVMPWLENKHKNKNIFGNCYGAGPQMCGPDTERFLEREMKIGIGSTCYIEAIGEDRMALLNKYGIAHMGATMMHALADDREEILNEIRNKTEATDQDIAAFEELCYQKAKEKPWFTTWFFSGESNPGMKPLVDHPETFAKYLIATYRGVKRFNKDATVLIEGGPCDMSPKWGIQYVEDYIRSVGGRVKFDAVGAHTYRTSPENPDLDSDTASLLQMLKKNNYDHVGVYWNEGMSYFNYNFPMFGMTPYKGNSGDPWYIGPLSYHMGWSEKIAAAFYARSWLVALKYQDRIRCAMGWQQRQTHMDLKLTPRALQKAANTLGHLLGNAVFREDIRFAPNSRCYLFEDETKRPIAALWSYIPLVDRGKMKAPEAIFNFGGLNPVFLDLMEQPCEFRGDKDQNNILPVSPFPLFIIGKPGESDRLAAAIRKGKLLGEQAAYDFPVEAIVSSLDDQCITLGFINRLSSAFEGQAAVTVTGQSQRLELMIPALETRAEKIPFAASAAQGQFPLTVSGLITGACGAKPFEFAIPVIMAGRPPAGAGAPTGDGVANGAGAKGTLVNWTGIPRIPLTNTFGKTVAPGADKPAEAKAFLQIVHDATNLYIAVDARDSAFFLGGKAPIKNQWQNDSIQLFIYTLIDGLVIKDGAGDAFSENNTYLYDFIPQDGSETVIAYRRFAPSVQAASGPASPKANEIDKKIQARYARTGDGWCCEMAIPRDSLVPVNLGKGASFGLNVAVNDRQAADEATVNECHALSPMVKPGQFAPRHFTIVVLGD